MKQSPLSTKEVAGLAVFYGGVGMFIGTFVSFIHPLVNLGTGGAVMLIGTWIFVVGRDARRDALRAKRSQS